MNKVIKIFFLCTLLVVTTSLQAGYESFLNVLNPIHIRDSLSFKQKVALSAGAITLLGVSGYFCRIMLKKGRVDQCKQSEQHGLLNFLSNEGPIVSFYDLKRRCAELPKFQQGKTRSAEDKKRSGIDLADLNKVLDKYFEMLKSTAFLNEGNWVKGTIPEKLKQIVHDDHFLVDGDPLFAPCVQKLVLPEGSEVILFGDRHGDVHSLLESLEDLKKKGYLDDINPFKIKKPNVYIGFLGDLVDRGWHGTEVIFTILSLWCANPTNVFLVRGNHEDLSVNGMYGFYSELCDKFTNGVNDKELESLRVALRNRIMQIYETLPLATFVGCARTTLLQKILSYFYYRQDTINYDYAVCCHGCVEWGFNPYDLLNFDAKSAFMPLGELRQKSNLDIIPLTPEGPMLGDKIIEETVDKMKDFIPEHVSTRVGNDDVCIGFQWSDVSIHPEVKVDQDPCLPDESIDTNRDYLIKQSSKERWIIGKLFLQAVLGFYSSPSHRVHGVFRGHQHAGSSTDPMMRRILNKDNCDHKENEGVGRLWLPENVKNMPYSKFWPGFVYTFNVSPHTPYQSAGFSFDTFGIWKLANKFEDWKLKVFRVTSEDGQKETSDEIANDEND